MTALRTPCSLALGLVGTGMLLLIGACGGSVHSAIGGVEPAREYEAESPLELEGEQERAVDELASALARPEVNCEDVCALRGVICDLSDRICGIAERHPGDREVQVRCDDSRARCESSGERVAASCACEPPPDHR